MLRRQFCMFKRIGSRSRRSLNLCWQAQIGPHTIPLTTKNMNIIIITNIPIINIQSSVEYQLRFTTPMMDMDTTTPTCLIPCSSIPHSEVLCCCWPSHSTLCLKALPLDCRIVQPTSFQSSLL